MRLDKILLVFSIVLFFAMALKKYPIHQETEESLERIEDSMSSNKKKLDIEKRQDRGVERKIAQNNQGNKEDKISARVNKNKDTDFYYHTQQNQEVSPEPPPSLNELKSLYDLSENHKIDLGEEFEFYISQNTLVKPINGAGAKVNSKNIVNQRWGFIEFEKNPDLSQNKNNQFPVVVSKQTGTVGYITGELVVPLDKYNNSEFPSVEVLRHDKDLNVSFLQTNNFDELQSLIKKYKDYKEFNLRIKDSHNYPI